MIAKILIAECPIAQILIAERAIAKILIAERAIAKILIAEMLIAKILIAEMTNCQNTDCQNTGEPSKQVPHGLIILTKFHDEREKIMELFLIANFWMCAVFF